MKRILVMMLMMVALGAYGQTTYYWVGGTATSPFTTNSNWNTALDGSGTTRAAADPTDILIISGSNVGGSVPTTGTVTTTIASTSVGQLKLINNATVKFGTVIVPVPEIV